MPEYIEREALLELYRLDDPALNETGHVPLPIIRQNIMDIPAADVVEVVRCRECRYSREDGGYDTVEQMETHLNCAKWLQRNHRIAIVPKDGFCSHGERRNDQ